MLQELSEYGDRNARFAALLETGSVADLRLEIDGETPAQITAAQALVRLLPSAT